MKTALILVDIQNDFCKGGSLEVPEGDLIVSGINNLINNNHFDVIIATQDYHPINHSSFLKNNPEKGIWPVHCVENTFGANFHPNLNVEKINKIIRKGSNPNIDSYSGFFDNDKVSSTGLDNYLKENNITKVIIVGLALDYCVKATAIDSFNLGFNTEVLTYLTRAVNISPNDGNNAIIEMKKLGIKISE